METATNVKEVKGGYKITVTREDGEQISKSFDERFFRDLVFANSYDMDKWLNPGKVACFNCGRRRHKESMSRWYHGDQDDLVCSDCASNLKHSDTIYSGMRAN